MQKNLKLLSKYLFIFIVGFCAYIGIEYGFRGYSHWTMGILGGISLCLVGAINEILPWEMLFWHQALIGGLMITGIEAIAGLILNVWLGLGIWDYSAMPLAFCYNQICLPFTIAWIFLAAVAIVLDDYLRYWFFGEEKPHYYFKPKRGD